MSYKILYWFCILLFPLFIICLKNIIKNAVKLFRGSEAQGGYDTQWRVNGLNTFDYDGDDDDDGIQFYFLSEYKHNTNFNIKNIVDAHK